MCGLSTAAAWRVSCCCGAAPLVSASKQRRGSWQWASEQLLQYLPLPWHRRLSSTGPSLAWGSAPMPLHGVGA